MDGNFSPQADNGVVEGADPREIVQLGAINGDFFCRTFFPQTFRQRSAPFHRAVWDLLEDPSHRRVAIKMFRGSAKTTLLRAFAAKRIAYGTSRTVLCISNSQNFAIHTLMWLRSQIEKNKAFSETFGLTPGAKWTDVWIQIHHKVLNHTVNVVAAGISGQIRGVNLDDWRPDLIVLDDPCDEENTGTEEQRSKIEKLFFGTIDKTLAPASESPDAKIAILQTPLAQGDLIDLCSKSPHWALREFSCFTSENESRWEERFPTKGLLYDKKAHADMGQLRSWFREMEVTITSDELMDFRVEWLQYWHTGVEATGTIPTFIGIDPVPPPSEREKQMGFRDKDYEVLTVAGYYRGNFYILEQTANHGHTPEWTSNELFRLWRKWRPLRVRVEATMYQRALQWFLEREMKAKHVYLPIEPVVDRRNKRHRIVQALSGIASKGLLFVHPDMHSFIEQFTTYPIVKHDDHLDSAAIALDGALEWAGNEIETENDLLVYGGERISRERLLEAHRGAP